MKKILQILAIAALFTIGATNFVLEAKKSCTGRAQSDCTGSCEWRHKACRHKVDKKIANQLGQAKTGTDASKVSAGSIIIYNTVTSFKNFTFVFLDINGAPVTAPTTIASADSLKNGQMNFKNRPFIIVPTNAKFLDVIYPGKNPEELVKVCDMLSLDISPNSLPQVLMNAPQGYATAAPGSFSNSHAVIVYDLFLNTEANPPMAASGILKFNVVFDLNDPFIPVMLTTNAVSSAAITEDTMIGQMQADPTYQTNSVNYATITKDSSLGQMQAGPSYQTFDPVDQFNGTGLVARAFSDGTAKIDDPAGVNPQSYAFNNVILVPNTKTSIPDGLMLIGTAETPVGFISGCTRYGCNPRPTAFNVYGQLITNN